MKFSSTPTTSVWKVFQPLTSKSAHPYSVALSCPNNFLTPRPGSTKWETILVSITTLVLHDSPQEHILSYFYKPRTSSLSRIFIICLPILRAPPWLWKISKLMVSRLLENAFGSFHAKWAKNTKSSMVTPVLIICS